MYTERAKKHHLPGINALLAKYNAASVRPEMLNHRDIGIVAMDDTGAVIGFTWLGLMAGNRLAYSEFSVADATPTALQMAKEMVLLAKKLGVQTIFANGEPPAQVADLCQEFGVN